MGRDGFLYEELLERVYAVINKNNPASGESAQKLVVPPPKLARIGTKKTAFSNFDATAKYFLSSLSLVYFNFQGAEQKIGSLAALHFR
jgi:translation initiation factor 2 beta subunit (eIF-2beta)/eIF-5